MAQKELVQLRGTVDSGRPYSLVMAEFSSDTLPLSQIEDPISDSFDSDRVLLESQARETALRIRLELNRLEEERRRKEQEDRITRLVDTELQRLRQREAEREAAEKSRLELIYRSFLVKEEVPVFQTSADLRPPRLLLNAGEAFDVDAILRRNQRRLQTLSNM